MWKVWGYMDMGRDWKLMVCLWDAEIVGVYCLGGCEREINEM